MIYRIIFVNLKLLSTIHGKYMPQENIIISFEELKLQFKRVLEKEGFNISQAELIASIFAENNLSGKASHGLNRFPGFIDSVRKGYVKKNVEPEKISSFNSLEQWDGKFGAGPVNAMFCMRRAIELSKEFGTGCVALRNTSHWMCGGTYGWKAAEAGFIYISWTNAIPMMPPWGSSDPKLGNNPFVAAIPSPNGHIVLDFALTQYSYGTLEILKQQNKETEFEAGFDGKGNLTKDPTEVLKTKRGLPVGLWKGTGFSLVLDLLASILSGGNSSCRVGRQNIEMGVSQVYLAFNPSQPGVKEHAMEIINETIEDLHESNVIDKNEIYYPGETSAKKRKQYLKEGIPVNFLQWKQLLEM